MLRNIGAVLAGMVAGSLVNMALILLNSFVLFPMPPGTHFNTPEQVSAYLATLPAVAFVVVMLAHLGQSFVGGWVAARLGGSQPMMLALIVGAFSLLGGILNMMSIRGPAWTYIELPLYLVVAWAAGRIEQNRRAGSGQASARRSGP